MKAPFCMFLLIIACGLSPAFAQQINLADLQARAAKGDPEAELELGRVYHLGIGGVLKDYVKAANLYRESAAQGNAKAMYNLGYLYHHAQGVPLDNMAAAQWFEKSAEAGLPAAELEVGLACYHGDNGEKLNFATAAKWLQKAAQPDVPAAQRAPAANALGNLYEHGCGLPLDGQQAVLWYTRAADLGMAKARSNLGRIYEEGLVVKPDPIQAYMWLKLAAYQADPMASHLFAELMAAKKFTPDQIAEGDQRVADYKEKHPNVAPSMLGALPKVIDPDVMSPPKIAVAKPAAMANPPGNGATTNAPVSSGH